MKKLLLAGLLIAAAFAADAGSYTCQIDHSALYATGQTRTDTVTGTLLWEYKCPMGHTFWIVPTMPNSSANQSPATQPQDYSYLHNAGKQAMDNTGQQMGQMLGAALQRQTKRPTDLVLAICDGHYHFATVTYSDGSIKTVDLGDKPSNQTELEQIKAAIPMIRVVDLVGCAIP
jgi:hypothetical protein